MSSVFGSKFCNKLFHHKFIAKFLWDFLGTQKDMGLSNFPSPAEGVLPVLVMNTILSVAFLKNMVRSLLQVMDATASDRNPSNLEEDPDGCAQNARERRISITQFKSLCQNRSIKLGSTSKIRGGSGTSTGSSSSSSGNGCTMECCVCLCRFEAEEEVSELSCKHFFHKGCLEKWFDNKHTTCPICRSMD